MKNGANILGLVGPLGAGKTEQAKAFVAVCGANKIAASRASCADPIRQMLMVLGVSEHSMAHEKNTPVAGIGCTPRFLMRTLGTEWGRRCVGENVWIDTVLRKSRARSEITVVDDVRFTNEATAIKQAGGVLCYIHNPNTFYTYEHLSEFGLDDWSLLDYVLDLQHARLSRWSRSSAVPERRPWWAGVALLRKFYAPVRATVRLRRMPVPLRSPVDNVSALFTELMLYGKNQ